MRYERNVSKSRDIVLQKVVDDEGLPMFDGEEEKVTRCETNRIWIAVAKRCVEKMDGIWGVIS